MIDWTKPIQTRDGKPARLLCTDVKEPDNRTALVLVTEPDGYECHQYHHADGSFWFDRETSDFDVINVPVNQTRYTAIYPELHAGGIYDSLNPITIEATLAVLKLTFNEDLTKVLDVEIMP